MTLFDPPFNNTNVMFATIEDLTSITGTSNYMFTLKQLDDGPSLMIDSRVNNSIGCLLSDSKFGSFFGTSFKIVNEDMGAWPFEIFELNKDTLWTTEFASKPTIGSVLPPSIITAHINKSIFLNDTFTDGTSDWTITPNESVVATYTVETLDNGKQTAGKCCVITATTTASYNNVFTIQQDNVDFEGVTSISLSTSYEIPVGNETYAECDVAFWDSTNNNWVDINSYEITSTHTKFTISSLPPDIWKYTKIKFTYQFMYFTVSPADPLKIYLSDIITTPNYSTIHTEWKEINDHTHLIEDITDLNITDFATTDHNHNTTYCRWRGSAASDPSDPLGGDIYYNSSDTKTYIYNGTAWNALN